MKRLSIILLSFTVIHLLAAQQNPLQTLLKKMEKENDTTKANSLLEVITIYGNRGLFDSADYYTQQMLTISEQSNYAKGLSMAYNAMGISKMVKGNYDEALKNFLLGLRQAEKTDHEKNIITLTMNIATIHTYQEDYTKAIPLLYKVLAFSIKKQNWFKSSGVATNIGFCYSHIGKNDSAKLYYDKGLDILKKVSSPALTGQQKSEYILLKSSSIPKTADFYIKNGDLVSAKKISLQFWEEIKEDENIYAKVSCLNGLARCYLKLNKFDSAVYYSNAGIKLMPGNEFTDEIKDFYQYKATANAHLGNYKEAYENKEIYQTLNDSVYNREKFKAVKDIQVKYETEKKEQEITSLNKEKKNQRLLMAISFAALLIALFALFYIVRSKKLQRKIFENEKLLQKNELEKKMAELEQTALRAQMNPHFIFNSLNSVQRFIIKNDAAGVNTYLTTFANLIRQTLENSGKKFIALKDELKYLETYLKLEQMRNSNTFLYRLEISPEIDTADIYIPNMILQPFIENSINHGFANKKNDDGKIELSFSKKQKLVCKIIDNGVGIQKNITTESDNSNKNHQPMGSSITRKRINAFNAMENEKIELEISNVSNDAGNDCGTIVTIKFPLKKHFR